MARDISTFWSIMVEIGFLGWIGCTITFIFQALTEDNKLVKDKALFWGIMIVIFYAIWVAGLKNA
jgi:hypothetical protein